ncbi:hypothetical cytosolic protein [Syntrophus aciditrophicus SB]|uniref:Hypothetical cytosolic protein n=1 Tax=Syntrophus aciditrophicus (strain SB) TaxID=56780 RepID=Q2LSI7_SYNAS|nr:hypothetical cytosolic protein [Syntrophus aciditrophicus SB]
MSLYKSYKRNVLSIKLDNAIRKINRYCSKDYEDRIRNVGYNRLVEKADRMAWELVNL